MSSVLGNNPQEELRRAAEAYQMVLNSSEVSKAVAAGNPVKEMRLANSGRKLRMVVSLRIHNLRSGMKCRGREEQKYR